MHKKTPTFKNQKGAVLILIAFILGLGAAAYLIKLLNVSNAQIKQDEKTYKALNEAKVALIAYAVSNHDHPGQMPYPDRSGDGNYDDTSDCYASNVAFSGAFTIGRLPLFRNDPNCINSDVTTINGIGTDLHDGRGDRLWYEVSRNLLHDYQNLGSNPGINPNISNAPPNTWLVVRDRNGAVISNRVAAIVISPGAVLPNQDRSGVANPNQYLDKIVMANGTPYQNYGYQDAATNPTQEFIAGDDYTKVAKNDPTYKDQNIQPYYFNDKLVFITIDELMEALERRAANEVRVALKKYYTNKSFYPYAAGLNLVGNQNQSIKGNLNGFLPIETASNYTCTCTNTKSCTCHFAGVNSVQYTRTSLGTYGFSGVAAPTGACSVDSTHKTCSCNGAGACKSSSGVTAQFTCNACGLCNSASTVNGNFTFIAKGSFSNASGGCSGTSSSLNCASSNAGSFDVNAATDSNFSTISPLPNWFKDNAWQDYIYYQISNNCSSLNHSSCLTITPQIKVGNTQNVRSLLITTGSIIGSQVRPSCAIGDYLDSSENTNNDLIFERTDKQRTNTYNDQTFIVSP